ncbi:MAG: hypothetical protein AAGC57_07040 [Pseudomonadota bacterium]
MVPYSEIGRYGRTLDAPSDASEARISDLLSIRHVNFVGYADDQQTFVPNVAKAWEWNEDFNQLTRSCAWARNGRTARPSPWRM